MNLDRLPAQILLVAARRESDDAGRRCRALLERSASAREVHAAFQRELARGGLTESGFSVLAALLAHEPGPLLRSDLAVAAGLSPMRATDALTRLEMSRLVRRHRDEQDRRLVWLNLTPAGRQQTSEALHRCVAAAGLVTGFMNEAQLEASIEISRLLRQGAARLNRETATAA